MTTDNVTDPFKPVWATVPARLLLACLVLGPFYVIGFFALANAVLPADDAQNLKSALLVLLQALTSASGIGTITSSNFRTWFKGKTQSAQAVAATNPASAAPSNSTESEMPQAVPSDAGEFDENLNIEKIEPAQNEEDDDAILR